SECYGNPDALHQAGRKAGQLMEASREKIASLLGVQKEEVLFCGSASEANTLALIGYALANKDRGNHILISNVEHPSVDHCRQPLTDLGFEVEYLPVHPDGRVHPDDVKKKMRKETILVSCMHVNNEVGSINPVREIAEVVHQHPVCAFHCDCVQSFSKIDVPFRHLDLATISAHKIHGLKGSALLIKKKNCRLKPVIQGGQQEQGYRGGTQNAPVNIVLAKTIRLALENQSGTYQQVKEINDYIRKELQSIPGSVIHSPKEGLPHILNIGFDSMTSEVLLNALDSKGICVSAKSTCSSHSSDESAVLIAMGKSHKEATHMIRLSFGADNTMEQAQCFIQCLKEILDSYGLSI
ncbi:MAG: cysteine desulfurase, partial [Erysipelotrichaceae bacterium]|nr:cysteine desulfurase [Erysipelotrichaceae bacterium]